MEIVRGVSIFILGFILGAIIWTWVVAKFRTYSGTIVVTKDQLRDKTVYSLILDEYPEKLQFEKVVIFRVDTSDTSEESSDRE